MRESYTKFSLSHINLSQLVNLLTSALFFHSLHIVVMGLPLLSPFVDLLSPLVSQYQIDLSIILQFLLLFYRTIFHLIYVRLFTTSLLLFQTRLCLIFQPLFSWRSWKLISFALPFLLSLYLPRLSQDWYLRYWPSFIFSSHTHFTIIHRHIIHANFYVICLWISGH